MTYAEHSAATRTRDDEHMIYEMGEWSQYSDGSVLNCLTMEAFTAEVAANAPAARLVTMDANGDASMAPAWLLKDLRRNAKAALKNGVTQNLAPSAFSQKGWIQIVGNRNRQKPQSGK